MINFYDLIPGIVLAWIVCYVLGGAIKLIDKIPNNLIPVILAPVGLLMGYISVGFTVSAILIGFIGAALSVYGFEFIKQIKELIIQLNGLNEKK